MMNRSMKKDTFFPYHSVVKLENIDCSIRLQGCIDSSIARSEQSLQMIDRITYLATNRQLNKIHSTFCLTYLV